MTDSVDNLVVRLAEQLVANGWKMAAAESCTGGWISKVCTDVPGSSAWFERAFITYSNEAKNQMLGVDEKLLLEFGAVSREVAEAMAEGAAANAPVQVSVAVTGVAGPDGGSDEKPVGTVWFAWSVDQKIVSECCRFDGDREAVRRQTVEHALERLFSLVKDQ
ncbi:MAG TPA: CinA family protein [Xanthomonadales bacterium]|nr:CinA family protein [Xanthomonadales bacterium]